MYVRRARVLKMHVCMCVYLCMYVCMDVCMDVWMYGCMHVCMYLPLPRLARRTTKWRAGCIRAADANLP